MNNCINTLTNWFLFFAGLGNIVLGTFSAYHSNSGIASICLIIGLIFLFAATIDRFESLKGLGVEATTRKLDQKIDEAEVALNYLKEMTAITSKRLVELECNVGRWSDGAQPEKFIEFADDIRKIMVKTGSNNDDIYQVLKPWAKTLCMDLSFKKIINLRKALSEKCNELQTEISNIPKPIDSANTDKFILLTQKINKINAYLKKDLGQIHLIEIDHYPEKLLALYDNAPYLEDSEIQELKKDLEIFIPEINLLKSERKINDKYLWIRALKES